MSDIALHSFFVYNSEYGPREGEEMNKILYYYPPNTDDNTKVKSVGLCEAIIKYVETFTDEPCQSVHTQKQRHLFYQAEENFWIIMKLNTPRSRKEKNDQICDEYHDENVHDSVYENVLKQAYNMFKLFMGSFKEILAKSRGDVISLKQRLEHFYSRYLITLKMAQCDILDVYNGIAWLPLDKNMYLRIQTLINRLEAKYPQIGYTAFLCSDYLVWTGLPQHEMRIIYQYLITSVFPAHYEQEMSGTDNSKRSFNGSHYGQFVTTLGGSSAEESRPLKIPKVCIAGEDGETREYQLVVYRALSTTVCVLVNGNSPVQAEFCRKFDSDLGPTLTDLATEIGQKMSKPRTSLSGSEVNLRYIYFNHMNLAIKTTVHVDTRKTKLVTVPVEVLSTIADINDDMKGIQHDCECLVKAANDYWIVCKRSDSRELYVVINERSANLTEINEEVKKLCASQFKNMFLLD